MKKPILFSVHLPLLMLMFSTLTTAQVTSATFSGVVLNNTGAVVRGAQLTVSNRGTGLKRSAIADDSGRFVISQLPPGTYDVTTAASGYSTLVHERIMLHVGQEAILTMVLDQGAAAEKVIATEETPLVNNSSGSVSGIVEEQQIEDLPVNGRDFSQLPLLQPGVIAFRTGDTTFSKGTGARMSMAGSRVDQTGWQLDGTEIRSPAFMGTPGGAAGVMLGLESVREFQVLTSNYSAQVGGTSGGMVNIVSKSGTNRFHGAAYYTVRNSALDARNFFDLQVQPFKRNQFGASLGAPIQKDKTFFFGNYEGLIQREVITKLAIVPDALAHQGPLIPSPGGGLQQAPVRPEIRPYLNLWPLPNGPSIGGGLAQLFASGDNPSNENYFTIRVDRRSNDHQSLFARFTYDQGGTSTPDPLPVTYTRALIHTRYTTVQHDSEVTPQLFLSTRLAANRTLLGADEIPLIDYPASLNLFLPGYLPTLGFAGTTSFGPNSQNILEQAQNLYGAEENLHYLRGGHLMRFGGQIEHVGSNRRGGSIGLNGSLTWSTLQAFLADQRLQTFSAAAPGQNNARSYVQYLYGIYFQDEWKMRPSFTWNFGVRYEPFTNPGEKHGRVSTVKDWVTATAFQTDIGLFRNPSKKDFAPRVGFAWDVEGDGKTVVRSAFGIFFVDLLSPYYVIPGQKNPPYFGLTSSVTGNLAGAVNDLRRIAPSLLTTTLTPNSYMELTQWNLNPAYEMKFNLMVERQLTNDLSVAAGYLGGRGIHLWRYAEINDAATTHANGRDLVIFQSPRINPQAGPGTIRYSDAQSFYNGLLIDLKKRWRRGFQFQAAYTLSKNIDDSTTGAGLTDYNEGVTSQPYNPKVDRGLSALHHGQNLVVNSIYVVPAPFQSGLLSTFISGWEVSNILTLSSGTPFSATVAGFNAPNLGRTPGVQHPDLVPDRSKSNIISGTTTGCPGVPEGEQLGTPNLYFDPCAFVLPPAPVGFLRNSGYYGNAGRNILIGPGLIDFDVRLLKSTPLGIEKSSRVEFQADFFNLLNRSNFGLPVASVLNASNRQYVPGAGQISKTVTGSRQVQFGLKLIF